MRYELKTRSLTILTMIAVLTLIAIGWLVATREVSYSQQAGESDIDSNVGMSFVWLSGNSCFEYSFNGSSSLFSKRSESPRIIFANGTILSYGDAVIRWCVKSIDAYVISVNYSTVFRDAAYVYLQERMRKRVGDVSIAVELLVDTRDMTAKTLDGRVLGRWIYLYRQDELTLGNRITFLRDYIIWRSVEALAPFMKPIRVLEDNILGGKIGEFKGDVIGVVKGTYPYGGLFETPAYILNASKVILIESEPIGRILQGDTLVVKYFIEFSAYIDADKGLLLGIDTWDFVDPIWVGLYGVKDSLSHSIVLTSIR